MTIHGTGYLFGFGMFRYAVEHMEDLLLSDKNLYGKPLEYENPIQHVTARVICDLQSGYDILNGLIKTFEFCEDKEKLECRMDGIKSYWTNYYENIISKVCFD
jgi:hypothetical protein